MKREQKEHIVKNTAISILTLSATVLIMGIISLIMPFSASADDTPLCEVHFRVVWHEQIVDYASVGITLEKYSDAEMSSFLGCVSFSAYQSEMWERVVKVTPGYYVVSHIVPTNEWRVIIDGNSDIFEAKEGVMYVYIGVAPPDRSFRLPEQWVVYGSDPPDFWIWSDSYFGEEPSKAVISEESIGGDEYTEETYDDTSTAKDAQEEPAEVSEPVPEPDEASEAKTYSMASETSETASSESGNHLIRSLVILGILVVSATVVIVVMMIIKRRQKR